MGRGPSEFLIWIHPFLPSYNVTHTHTVVYILKMSTGTGRTAGFCIGCHFNAHAIQEKHGHGTLFHPQTYTIVFARQIGRIVSGPLSRQTDTLVSAD